MSVFASRSFFSCRRVIIIENVSDTFKQYDYGGLIMEITRETLISEIIDNCPQAFPVFQEIGMHCMGCALASGETLEQACAAHGVDPDEFLTYLKAYLEVSNP